MSKVFLVVIVFLLLRLSQNSCFSAELLTHNNPAGITIKYPANWTMQDFSKFFTQNPNNILKASVIFLSPKENSSDSFQENMAITAVDYSADPITLSALAQQTIEASKAVMKKFIVIEKGSSIKVNGNSAYKIVYSGKMPDGYTTKVMSIYINKKNILYTFVYTAELTKYDKFEKVIQIMLNSIVIK